MHVTHVVSAALCESPALSALTRTPAAVHVCMYVCMYICMCIYALSMQACATAVCPFTGNPAAVHVCMYVPKCVRIYIYIYI